MDFKKLVKPLGEYYGSQVIQDAIKQLKTWYEDEAYDSDDVVADWNVDAFDDSEGIDKLVECLNYPELLNNMQQKRILYSHCCYYLLPDEHQPPTQQLIKHMIAEEEPFEKIHGQFKRKLTETLHIPIIDAKRIIETFIHHIEEQEYDVEGIEDDLDNIDESEIINNIIEKFPNLSLRKNKIFDILYAIVTKKEITKIDDYGPLELKMSSTEEDIKEASRLSKVYLKDVFTTKDSGDVEEKAFIIAKSYDISNQYPWLSNMADTYVRFILETHKRNCQQTKDKDALDKLMSSDEFISLNAKDWFEKHDPYTRKLIQNHATKASYLCHGIMALFNRLAPRMNINYKIDFTIVDSYDAYARYAIAINEFIYTLSSSPILQCTPIQFDFLIIPTCVSTSMYYDDGVVYDDLWQHMPAFLNNKRNIDEEKKNEPKPTFFGTGNTNGVSSDSKNNNNDDDDDDEAVDYENKDNKDPGQPIWNIENYLQKSGYLSGRDYFGPVNINLYSTQRMVKVFNENLWRQVVGGEQMRYKRYIIVIDRRNPNDIRNKKMRAISENNRKIWDDRVYLICPQKYGEICKEYQYKMNEIFMQNLKEFLLPNPYSTIDFGALVSGNGYKFVLNYQIHSQDKVKVYWYLNSGYQRFFMHDIEWLWNRFFIKTNDEFQQLSLSTKNALQRAKIEHQLVDKQFIRYRQGYKLLN